jgi:hypothetical protein
MTTRGIKDIAVHVFEVATEHGGELCFVTTMTSEELTEVKGSSWRRGFGGWSSSFLCGLHKNGKLIYHEFTLFYWLSV